MPSDPTAGPPGAAPAVSVVVATRDRPDSLRATLDAVTTSLRPGDELVVVDSASSDRRVRAVANSSGARVVECDVPGTSRARNAGGRATAADVIAFTDDDCLPDPGWVTAVSAAFARHPELGFMTGRVVAHADGGGGRVSVSVVDDDVARFFLAGDDPGVIGHGANMAWRRSALEGIGGFDEVMGPGAPLRAAEDHDAFWRALRAGFTGCYEPAAIVRHRQWRRSRQQLVAFYGYGVGAGALFVKRWRLAPGGDEARRLSLLRRREGRRALRGLLWDRGAAAVGRRLAEGYELGALAEAIALLGAVRGARRSTPLVGDDGHFVWPEKRRARRHP
jgi:GT2 family glycosyltransferase